MDKELFYKNQVLNYLIKVNKDEEPSEIECYLDELGEENVFRLFKKYHLKDEKYYLDKYKDFDLSNNHEEYQVTTNLNEEVLDLSKLQVKESTIDCLEELSTYVFILLNNKELLRAKEVATFIFKYTITFIKNGNEDDFQFFEFLEFYQDLALTYLEKEAIESGYQEYLIEEGEEDEIFYYLFLYSPSIYTKLLDTLMNDKKEFFKSILDKLDKFDLETYEELEWYSYLLTKIEDLDFLFDALMKNPDVSKLDVFERTMKLLKSKKKNINKEKLKIYKYKTDLFINNVLKDVGKDASSVIFKMAFNTFDDEMSYLINEYTFNNLDLIYSFIRFNAASDDVFNAFIKPSDQMLLNLDSRCLFEDILRYKNDIIYLSEALFDNTDINDPIFLKGCKEIRRRNKTSLDVLYNVLLKSVINTLTTIGPNSNFDSANFVYDIYRATDGEFDMRDDLIKALPTRKAFHRDLRVVFPTHDYFW